MPLRPYQEDALTHLAVHTRAVDGIEQGWNAGHSRILLSVSMGFGVHDLIRQLCHQQELSTLWVTSPIVVQSLLVHDVLEQPGIPHTLYPFRAPLIGFVGARDYFLQHPDDAPTGMDVVIVDNIGPQRTTIADTLPLIDHLTPRFVLWITPVGGLRFVPPRGEGPIDAVIQLP